MNVSPDQVRAATRSAAAVITPDQVPPLRLEQQRAGRPEAAPRPRPAWFAPLAAAAAVVVIAVASATAGSLLARSVPARSGHPAAADSGASTADPAALSGVPRYYAAVEGSAAVVRATATGATLVKITTATPFAGVAAGADDRTFVLDAQRQVIGPNVTWPEPPMFYLLRLRASGREESLTRLKLAPPPKGTAVTGLALSPDDSKLAVEVDSDQSSGPGLLEIRVYTLSTGKFRSWSAKGLSDPEDSGGFTGSGTDGAESISWAANSRTLGYEWTNASYAVRVSLLDTAAHGDNLLADSWLAVTEHTPGSRPVGGPPDYVSPCVTDSILSPDGLAVDCGYATTLGARNPANAVTISGFIRYSTRTGKPVQVDAFPFKGETGGDNHLWWTSATGQTLIGAIGTRHGIQVGVISGHAFRPLPGTAGLTIAAW
jgi:hypothetical protein